MIKFGQVTAYDEHRRTATISYIRPDACEKCRGCGSMSQTGSITLKAECKVGDWVKVELPDGRFLSATVMAYAVPLVTFLAGLLLGYQLSGQNELIALLASLGGLGAGVVCIRLCEKHISGKPEWTPRITQTYDHKPDIGDLGCGGE